jgi:RHS repeat-associated protein
VVDLLIVEDLTGASPRMETHYDYLDDPAWHYDDSELVDKDKRTWSQWRGYSRVRVRKGLEQETQSVTEYLYMRGMNGDRASPSGGTKSVQITDSQGTSVTDHEAHTGFLREETTINGLGGEWVSGTINTPWRHGPTATSGPLKAWLTNTSTVRARTNLAAGGVRWTRTTTSFDTTYGMPTQVDDRGDEAITADDRCVRHEYARNPSIWMVDKVRRTETVGVRCSQTPQRPGDVLSDERTFYDDPDTFGAPPTRGLAVKQQEVDSWTGGTPVWLTTERSTFDARGRVLSVSDALNQTTSTSYVPAASGPLTRTIETNPAGHTETMTLEPAWGLPTGVVDANGHVADLTYDGAGRLTAVWLPGRDNQTQSASLRFAYELRADAPTAVTSKKLLPDGVNYITSVILYDGNLRERQTQTQTHGGGRLLEDTVYDSRGLVEMKAEPYYDPSNEPPSTTLVGPAGTVEIPGLTRKVYDGAERVLHEIFMDRGQEAWRSSFGYGGDRVHMTPPAGGTATTTIKDARDRTVALRQYHGPTPSGAYDETTYAYSRRDELASVTDPVGNTWTYAYDQRGRQVTAADPDTGTTTMTYDAIGQDLTVTDGRGETVGYTYDALGRITSVRSGSPAGAKLAEWVFDTLPDGVGKLTRSVRYHDGEAYTKEILGYNEQGEPTGTRVTIPAAEVGLAGSYESLTTYQPDGSSVATTTLPAAGDLGAEELAVGYDDAGAATWLVSALSVYVGTVSYSTLGDLTGRELGTFGRRTGISYTYDDATRRLMATSAMVETGSGPVEVLDLSYRYDAAENLVRIADAPGSTSTPNDTQCYRYDHLQRLTDAWTPASTADTNCDTYPGPLGGQAPYRLVWTYDQTGNRLSQTRYGLGGGTTTYDHPAPGAPHPHAVSGAVTSGPGGSGVASYEYDDAGNLVERDRDGEVQTLSWDAEGRVATVQDSGGQTEFIYDADGNRLIRRDPDGKTLYLPSTELRYDNATGQRTCTRYYEHLGTTVAVRTAEGLYWLVNDHHQTGEVAVRDSDGQTVRRRTTPFGQPRGQAPAWWPGDKGFVGGTEDPTGLIHLGARLYDSALGRFISVDPIIDEQKPQQMHGYAYSNNAPPTFTDPDGEFLGKLREKVANAAGGAARAVGNAARSAGRATHNFLKDNYKVLDTVSTVLGVAAIACTAIPPLQVAAPFLGAASIAVGAAATYGACASGDAASCGLGLVGMIPGGKAVALGARAARTGIKAARMGVKKGNKNRVFNRWYNVKDNPKVSPRVRSRARNQVASLNLSQVSWSEYHYYSAKISMKQTFRAQQVFNPRRFLDRLDILHKNVSLLNSISRDSAPGSYYPGSAGGGYSPPRGGGGSSGTSRPSTRPSRGGGGGGTNYFF